MKMLYTFLAVLTAVSSLFLATISQAQEDACYFEADTYIFDNFVFEAVAGDLDGDNDVDLVVEESGIDQFLVLANDGQGVFSTIGSVPKAGGEQILVDIDGDNDLDLCVFDFFDMEVRFFTNDGNATFTFFDSFMITTYLGGLAFEDLDGDGDKDLALTSRFGLLSTEPGIVSLYYNDGSGNFSLSKQVLTAPVIPSRPVIVDLDGDGDKDIVVSGITPMAVGLLSVYRNNGRTFDAEQQFAVGAANTGILYLNDLNADGFLDAIVSDFFAGVFVVFGTAGGNFGAPVNLIPDLGDDNGYRPEVGVLDIDGDMDLDLVTMDGLGDAIDVLLNSGDGTFETELRSPTGNSPNSIPIADFDGDGRLDAAITHSSANMEVLYFHCDTVLFGDINGDGTVSLLDVQPFVDLITASQFQIEADGNRDNRVDLLDVAPFVEALGGGG